MFFFIRTLNNIHMMFNKHIMNINLVINLQKIEIKLCQHLVSFGCASCQTGTTWGIKDISNCYYTVKLLNELHHRCLISLLAIPCQCILLISLVLHRILLYLAHLLSPTIFALWISRLHRYPQDLPAKADPFRRSHVFLQFRSTSAEFQIYSSKVSKCHIYPFKFWLYISFCKSFSSLN